jgi:hypothetical protein
MSQIDRGACRTVTEMTALPVGEAYVVYERDRNGFWAKYFLLFRMTIATEERS